MSKEKIFKSFTDEQSKAPRPTFSIIMPAYNAGRTIERAIKSVLYQTEEDFELLIINDGSIDNTELIVRRFVQLESRITLINLDSNKGVSEARNVGIKAARAPYIAFLDADDFWLREKLRLQRAALDLDCDVVCSAYLRKTDKGHFLTDVPEKIDFTTLLKGNCIGNLTGVYNADRLGKFFQESIGHEDYLMWLQIVHKAGHAKGIQQPLAVYSVQASSVSSNKLKSALWTWKIFNSYVKMSYFKSIMYFFIYIKRSILIRIKKTPVKI